MPVDPVAEVEPEPAQVPDAVPTDAVADVEPVSEYDSWRTQQIETAETVFPTTERDALVSRLIDADEKVNRADGRDEEWLARQREDLTDLYNDRGSAIGEVGARSEKQRLLQLATKFEAMAAAEPPGAMLGDNVPSQEPEYAAADAMTEPAPDTITEPDTVSGETPASEPDAVAAETVVAAEPEAAQEPESAAAYATAEPEPDTIAEPDTVSGETPGWKPDAVAAETVVAAEPEAAQEPEYAAADAMMEPAPDTITEPDTVSGETPAWEPDAVAAATVVAAEPEAAQEPEYAVADAMTEPAPDTITEPDTVSGETPAWEPDAVAAATVVAVEPAPVQEPDAMPADPVADVEPEPVQEVDPVPSEPELEQRLRDCEVLPIPVAASRVEEDIQQDMDRARSALESAAAYAGLPSITELPDNVERLELREDGSVVAVIDEDADTTPPVTEPVAEMPDEPAPAPDISDAGDAPISPPATAGAGDVDRSAETTDPMESDPSVAVQSRWHSMSMAEKAAAIARYNEALENYRKQQELARLLQDEGDNADLLETYCGYLRERLREQNPDGPQIVALASPKPPAAVDMSQVQLRKTGAGQRSSRPGLQPRSRVARMLMGDVRPRQTATPPVGSVKEAMESWPSLPQVQFREPERELVPVPVAP